MDRGKYLDRELYGYGRSEVYPFHMPGHKRQAVTEYLSNPYLEDITEITDFDNLHHAEGILKEAQEYAGKIFRTYKSYFLINGSTAGILAAASACTQQGGRILMARNCHKAAYHAVYLRDLKPVYLYPSWNETLGLNGGIDPKDVEDELRIHKDIQAVLVTSPTYDGVVSDIKKISNAAHKYGIPLIVDEAHGAHFPFHDFFPESALYSGGDIVIQSLHKTLPSLTQTALLHLQSELVSRERLETFLGIYQTSSPSYILMGSISACLRYLEEQGEKSFDVYADKVAKLRKGLRKLKNLSLAGSELIGRGEIFDLDLSKLIISEPGNPWGGPFLHKELREKYGLELEMEAPGYVLALTSVMDTEEGFQRLGEALEDIDFSLDGKDAGASLETEKDLLFTKEKKEEHPRQIMTIAQAMENTMEVGDLENSKGKISGEFAYLYPPGIPLLVPGEEITEDFLKKADSWKSRGIYLQGLTDHSQKKIKTVKENK